MAPDLAGMALIVWLAQPSPAQPTPVPPAITQPQLPVSVDRIQRKLAKPAPIETEESMAIFRLTIEARPMRFKLLWDTSDPMLPSYVRPRMPLYHYEFLMAVTPEAFRGGVLYPIAIDVLPFVESLADRIREAWQKRREARARKEVDEALRQFFEAQKAKQKKEDEKR
jgi:hypothetical protein